MLVMETDDRKVTSTVVPNHLQVLKALENLKEFVVVGVATSLRSSTSIC